MDEKNVRSLILDSAKEAVTQRAQLHGKPENNFANIANFWSSYLGRSITPADVANMMILFKVARSMQSPDYVDNYIDIAGYAACGAECAVPLKIVARKEE